MLSSDPLPREPESYLALNLGPRSTHIQHKTALENRAFMVNIKLWTETLPHPQSGTYWSQLQRWGVEPRHSQILNPRPRLF